VQARAPLKKFNEANLQHRHALILERNTSRVSARWIDSNAMASVAHPID
jgi:hypothetical protein